MTSPGLFLCGCNPLDKQVQNYTRELVQVPGLKEPVLSSKRYDKHGNEICPIHGKPLYGFMTPTKTGPQGNDVYDHRAEVDRIYGKSYSSDLHGSEGITDIRDTRTPEEAYADLMAERDSSNGKAIVQ